MRRAVTSWRFLLTAGLLVMAQPLLSVPAEAASGDTVVAWGLNQDGQVGNGTLAYSYPSPVSIGPGNHRDIVAVSAGAAHTLALRQDGSVLAWGSNQSGQLGIGDSVLAESAPVSVKALGGPVVAVAAGKYHSLAVRADGTVLSWGTEYFGELGDGGTNTRQSTPVPVSGLGAGSGVIAVSAGGLHSLALRADGSVLAWGLGGLVGDGTVADRTTPVPVSGLGAASGVIAVSAGASHSLALRSDGRVVAWGDNDDGKLGDGSNVGSQPKPVPVTGLGVRSGIVAVSAGEDHSLALRGNGSVLAWGSDTDGQLGDGGANTSRSAPVDVRGLGTGSGVVSVSAGGNHSLAVRRNGSVRAWGDNYYGELGDSTNQDRSTPVAVTGLSAGSGITAVSAGRYHSLALRSPPSRRPRSGPLGCEAIAADPTPAGSAPPLASTPRSSGSAVSILPLRSCPPTPPPSPPGPPETPAPTRS